MNPITPIRKWFRRRKLQKQLDFLAGALTIAGRLRDKYTFDKISAEWRTVYEEWEKLK